METCHDLIANIFASVWKGSVSQHATEPATSMAQHRCLGLIMRQSGPDGGGLKSWRSETWSPTKSCQWIRYYGNFMLYHITKKIYWLASSFAFRHFRHFWHFRFWSAKSLRFRWVRTRLRHVPRSHRRFGWTSGRCAGERRVAGAVLCVAGAVSQVGPWRKSDDGNGPDQHELGLHYSSIYIYINVYMVLSISVHINIYIYDYIYSFV